MTTYNERCTIVANPDATIKTIFVDRMGIDDSGRHYSIGQETIGGSELEQFIGGVLNQALADKASLTTALTTMTTERDGLLADKATLTADKESLTTELAELQALYQNCQTLLTEEESLNAQLTSQIESLTSQLAAKTDELAESKAELLSQVDSLEAERIVLHTKITFLNSIRTYDPNSIRSLAFYDRITKDQINKLGLVAITDPQAAEIHVLLNAYKDNPWPVLLDDPLVVGGIQYLQYIEIITPEEAAQITRPATRDEAFIAE
jgi:hypothetical protein